MTEEELTDYFAYLDELREGGATNMFGAAPYLTGTFGISREEASEVIPLWMKYFDRDRTAAARAADAFPQVKDKS